MSFYYNYTGPYPGTLRVNQANQTPSAQPEAATNPWPAPPPTEHSAPSPSPQPAGNYFVYYPRFDDQPASVGAAAPASLAEPPKPAEPVNPWLAPPPMEESTPAPAPQPVNNHFVYYPRYDFYPAPAAPANLVEPPKPAEPVNPWLAPRPEAAKASPSHAHAPFLFPAQPSPTYQPQAPLYYAGQPMPEPAKIWYGSTKAEVDAQNRAIAPSVGAYTPMQLAPANPTAGQQFWTKETNGAYTLRTMTDIETSCQPGSWATSAVGYPYFVRK
ncbi:MAG: hypothetical protein Q9166_005914 [cf. Caloplaca sp. 2 TL-2023]